MLLPQLEHGMRRFYCVANSCQERLLTAEVCIVSWNLSDLPANSVLVQQSLNGLKMSVSNGR